VLVIQGKKSEAVRKLLSLGKERGYLLIDEVNDVLAAAEQNAAETDELFSRFENEGVEILEDAPPEEVARGVLEVTEGIAVDPNLALRDPLETEQYAGALDKSSDSVRTYLKEMGAVPLLSREKEVAIAKRIERGHLLVLKTISRCPLVLKDLIRTGRHLHQEVGRQRRGRQQATRATAQGERRAPHRGHRQEAARPDELGRPPDHRNRLAVSGPVARQRRRN